MKCLFWLVILNAGSIGLLAGLAFGREPRMDVLGNIYIGHVGEQKLVFVCLWLMCL